jgi:hypothetical protein
VTQHPDDRQVAQHDAHTQQRPCTTSDNYVFVQKLVALASYSMILRQTAWSEENAYDKCTDGYIKVKGKIIPVLN